jgi:hypothetical protein
MRDAMKSETTFTSLWTYVSAAVLNIEIRIHVVNVNAGLLSGRGVAINAKDRYATQSRVVQGPRGREGVINVVYADAQGGTIRSCRSHGVRPLACKSWAEAKDDDVSKYHRDASRIALFVPYCIVQHWPTAKMCLLRIISL